MGNYVIRLVDLNGLSCRIKLSLPFFQNGTGPGNSSWKVVDEGFLKYRSGHCQMIDTSPGEIFTNGNLLLVVGNYFGVNLFSFAGKLGYANDSGSGSIHQLWVVNCQPGHLEWSVLE